MDGFPGALPGTDEVFWASVVRKWSEACETVVSLRRDLTKAQEESRRHQQNLHKSQAREAELSRQHSELKEECKFYRDRSYSLLQGEDAHCQTQSVASTSVSSNGPDEKTRHTIRETELELERAKHEYVKIEEQLSKSREEIQTLSNEFKALQEEKKTAEENNCVLTKENIRLDIELTRSRSEYDTLKDQKLAGQNQELRADFITQTRQLEVETARRNELESKHDATDAELASRAQEIHALKVAATVNKQEISALRDELVLMREKLSKSTDTNKTLLDNFTKLNAKLREPTLTHAHPQPLRRPPATAPKEEPVPAGLNAQDGVSIYRRVGSRIFIRPATSPVHCTTPSTSQTASQQSIAQAASLSTVPTPIPEARQRSLTELIHYIPDIDREDCRFRRALLAIARAIGGSIQSLIVRVTQSRTALAKTQNISTYLCPALELNPWCPTSPGQHGYIFVGLDQERNTFQEPQAGLNLFMGYSRSSSRPKEYQYLGVYTAARVANLYVEEWDTL